MGMKLLKIVAKSALEVAAGVLIITDGIMLRDLLWMKIDKHAKKKAEKEAAKAEAKAA